MIRVADRKDRKNYFNISVFRLNGERLKLLPEQLKDAVIVSGMPASERKDLTDLIQTQIEKLIELPSRVEFNKKSFENALYGDGFLNKHKKKRTREYEIEIRERIPTDYHHELRKQYPLRSEIQSIKTIDSEGFEKYVDKEVVIDPLSMEEFPKYFSPELYEKFKDRYLKTLSQQAIEMLPTDKWFFDKRLEMFIVMNKLLPLFKSVTTGSIKVNKDVVNEFEKKFPKGRRMVVKENSDKRGLSVRFVFKNELMRDIHNWKLPSHERFEKEFYDNTNIFELFASIKYRAGYAEDYNKIVIRLFQYRYFKKPKEKIDDLSKEWFTDFFTYLWNTGYYKVNTVSFDPLASDYWRIFKGKTLVKYKKDQLDSLNGITRTVLNKFLEEGLILKRIDLPIIATITGKQSK